MSHIELRGVRVHNLKGIDLRLPLGKLIAIAGVSGSGKSSLAFDTLVAEGHRRYIETFAASDRQLLERIERPDADSLDHLPPAVAFRADAAFSARATIGAITETDDLLSVLFARSGQAHCPKCQSPLLPRSPDDIVDELLARPEGVRFVIAFPAGQTTLDEWRQRGFVRAIQIHRESAGWSAATLELANHSEKSVQNANIWIVADRLITGKTDSSRLLDSVAQAFQHGGDRCVILRELSENSEAVGQACDWDGRRWNIERHSRQATCFDCEIEFPALEPDLFSFENSLGACPQCSGLGCVKTGKGSLFESECSDCNGSRLRSFGRSVRISRGNLAGKTSDGSSIVDLRRASITELAEWANELTESSQPDLRPLIEHVAEELSRRLKVLIELGLGNLSLSRSLSTLSRGERQRVRLAGMLATRLDNALYVFEEPSSGLHPTDAGRVLAAIQRLQLAGNTVILVEHNRDFVQAADEVIELGPGAGKAGGQVIYQGSPELAPIMTRETNLYARGRLASSASPFLCLNGVSLHNLRDFDVSFPLNSLCVLTGVSGSGKSSLIEHTLFPVLCQRLGIACSIQPVGTIKSLSGAESVAEVVFLDSMPIRKSDRANAATLLGFFASIRQLFAETTEAKVKNFTARHFSFNAADGGRCTRCRGLGMVEIDMQFLASLEVICPECHGSRFQREILEAKLRGLSIAEVLNLSADETFTFFRGQPVLQRRLKSVKDVGLGYLPLGQSATSLSRGECQRLKLAARLMSHSRKPTLFLMDEPTSGLHPSDVEVLLECFRRLIEDGHSIIAIENRPEFVLEADHVVEMPTNLAETLEVGQQSDPHRKKASR